MAAYEQAMKDPSVQAQAQQMAQVMQSKEIMEKMAHLQVRPRRHAGIYAPASPGVWGIHGECTTTSGW